MVIDAIQASIYISLMNILSDMSFSVIANCFQSSLDLEWDYIINMSESDELVLSLKELEAQLDR